MGCEMPRVIQYFLAWRRHSDSLLIIYQLLMQNSTDASTHGMTTCQPESHGTSSDRASLQELEALAPPSTDYGAGHHPWPLHGSPPCRSEGA